jgi:hypothetical protein
MSGFGRGKARPGFGEGSRIAEESGLGVTECPKGFRAGFQGRVSGQGFRAGFQGRVSGQGLRGGS